MAKQILFNEEARRSLERGVDALADAVKPQCGIGKEIRFSLHHQ